MQGYIINLNKVKDEDLIVTILSHHRLKALYRFYGARHGTINIGFNIDYEIEPSAKSTIGRLKDTQDLGSFYFQIFEHASEQLASNAMPWMNSTIINQASF